MQAIIQLKTEQGQVVAYQVPKDYANYTDMQAGLRRDYPIGKQWQIAGLGTVTVASHGTATA